MDPLIFALVITLPMIAVSLLVWLWVRRSPTPDILTRRRNMLYSIWIAFCVVVLLGKVFTGSRLYRSIVGISAVTFSNNSRTPLQDFVMITRGAEGQRHTNNIELFPPRGKSRLAVNTRALALESLACLRDGQHLACTNGGVATPRKDLHVSLDSAGQFSSTRK